MLSDGSSPTGTITFTLTYNNSVVYTDHVTVTGDGTYSTAQGDNPGGHTLPNTGTVVGTYQWAASYSGDSQQPPGPGPGWRVRAGHGEPGQPDDRHHARPDQRHAGHHGGDPQRLGRLVRGLFPDRHDHLHPGRAGGATVDTETVDGQRQWHVHDADRLHAADDRDGDGHLPVERHLQAATATTTTASDINSTTEQVAVSPATPTIATTPDPTSVTLGTTTVTLKDSAVLSGGFSRPARSPSRWSRRAARPWTPRRSRSTAMARTRRRPAYTLPTTGDGDGHLPVERQLQRRRQQQPGQRHRCARPSR